MMKSHETLDCFPSVTSDVVSDTKETPDVASTSGDGSRDSSIAEVDSTVDTKCGYYHCKPGCLQRCATPRFLLVSICAFAVVDAFVQWGIVNVNMSTWERRFQLSSIQSSAILITGPIVSLFLNPIFGYLGTYYHKGHMVAMGTVCMTVANLLFLVPHFAAGPYELSGAYAESTCQLDASANVTLLDQCDGQIDTNMSRWIAFFCVAQVFNAYVGTSLWVVALTWIDESVKYRNAPMYIAIFNTSAAIGACLGFVFGGLFLQIYVDVGRVDMDEVTIEPSDPRWVGAWWIGFAVAAVAGLPSVFMLFCFPRELPDAARYRAEKVSEAYKGIGEKESQREDFGRSWKDVRFSLKVVFCNPVFILITIAGAVEAGGVSAFASYLPKIIQFQFGASASLAAIMAGAVLVPGAALGQMLGGIIPKCAGFRFRGTMLMIITAQLTCVLCCVGLLVSCPSPQIAGYNTEYYYNSTHEYDDPLTHSCNADCNCTTLEFIPICSQREISYFSPCYAGCATEAEVDGATVYGNCSCLPNATLPVYQAEDGLCSTQCNRFWIFTPLVLVFVIATFMESTGAYVVVLRCVPDKQRTFAFGVQGPLLRIFGTIPIPILFGVVFDTACDIWQDNCGEQGSCWVYDSEFLAWGMFTAGLIIKGVSGTCFLTALCIYKPPVEERDKKDGTMERENTVDITDEIIVRAVTADDVAGDHVVKYNATNDNIVFSVRL